MDGIDEASLTQLVDTFYRRVRADPELGPVFNDAIADWPAHLEQLAAFWSSVMLNSGRYKGNPMRAHLNHAARISPALFERWLGLWREAAAETMPAPAAAALRAKAARIADSLRRGLFTPLPPAAATREDRRPETPVASTLAPPAVRRT
jgi:hemoglobin